MSKIALPVIPREYFKDKKLIEVDLEDTIYQFDEDNVLMFDISDDRKFSLNKIRKPQAWDQTQYIYCGQLYSEGKLCAVYKSKKVKGYLGYIKFDIQTPQNELPEGYVELGHIMQGLVLVNKEKYFLYNGEIWSYRTMTDAPLTRIMDGSRTSVMGWGEIIDVRY